MINLNEMIEGMQRLSTENHQLTNQLQQTSREVNKHMNPFYSISMVIIIDLLSLVVE
jgi:hypothetical protein